MIIKRRLIVKDGDVKSCREFGMYTLIRFEKRYFEYPCLEYRLFVFVTALCLLLYLISYETLVIYL